MPSRERIQRYQGDLEFVAASFGHSWTPKSPRAYDIPQPMPSEALSSWILRCAADRHQSPNGILSLFGATGRRSLFWRDFCTDALPWDYVGELICADADSLRLLVLAWDHYLCRSEFLCLQADPMRMRPQLRYCRECFAEDSIPYYRQSWRLSSTWICPTHLSAMRDACPHCNVCVGENHSLRLRNRVTSLRTCPSCGGDLCAVDSTEIPVWLALEITAIQSHFEELLEIRETGDRGALVTAAAAENKCSKTAISDLVPDLKGPLVKTARPQLSCHDARAKLAGVLRILDFTPDGDFPPLNIGIGIEANRLFGQKTGHICSFLMHCQSLFGTTLWSAGEELLKDAMRTEWSPLDYSRARQWVLRCIEDENQNTSSEIVPR